MNNEPEYINDFREKANFDGEILNINDPEFVDKFTKKIGVKPGDSIRLIIPPHERGNTGPYNGYVPQNEEELNAVKAFSKEVLFEIGCREFHVDLDGFTLWLYPGEWFDYIPKNYEVDCISGETLKWDSKECDNDIRFGCLAYGFKRK